MAFDVDTAWLMTVVLVTIRLGVLFFATPFDGVGNLPVQIRVFITLALAVMMVGASAPGVRVMPASVPQLLSWGLREALIGLVMAFGLYCVVGAVMVAGKLIDFQAGFGAAEIMNPATSSSSPLTGTVLSLLMVTVFFLSGAAHLALKGIAWSLQVSPPGGAFGTLPLDAIVKQFGITFLYGFVIAAPVIGVLLLLETGLAIMGRSMPQLNVYFLFLPLKIGVALGLTAVAVRYLSPVFERLFIGTLRYWQQALA